MKIKVFTAPNCGPCTMTKVQLDRIIYDNDYPNFEVKYIDISTDDGLNDALANGVSSTPTLIFSNEGSDYTVIVGFRHEFFIRQEIEKHL